LKANEVIQCLKDRFCSPDWLFATELGLIPGFISGRRADAVALNCLCSGEWGLSFLGLEVKVSRQDLLNELKNPKKRQETYVGTDAIFICAPKGICDKKELPDDLGLIECGIGKAGTWTRLKKKPKDLKLPMEAVKVRKPHPEFKYMTETLELDKIPPIDRAVVAAFVRAFDPSRINQHQLFENIRLKRLNDEFKSKLKYAKNEAHEEFRTYCYKKGIGLHSGQRETFVI